MSKSRVRSKTAKKGLRWGRGQSSSSNPQKTKFRDAAKAKSLIPLGLASSSGGGNANAIQSGPNKLTAETLLKHDVLLGRSPATPATGTGTASQSGMEQDEDTLTLGQTHKTFDTFASDWTQCTNVSFHKLITRYNPSKHKEMLAILAAITSVRNPLIRTYI